MFARLERFLGGRSRGWWIESIAAAVLFAVLFTVVSVVLINVLYCLVQLQNLLILCVLIWLVSKIKSKKGKRH